MKKLSFLPGLLLLAFTLSAQNSAKKYVLLEHFTNSNCSTCALRNPTFFGLIGQAQYVNDVHHISIHPPYPYSACVFYQANTADNSAWAALYDILGTPRVAVNGNLMPPSSQLLRVDSLNKYVGLTSPLQLKVTETGAATSRSIKIEAQTLDQIPTGNYKLFVAIVEKTITLTTPNNEPVHHNVFRDMITPVTGIDFTPPAPGQSQVFNYDYNITSPWNANEIYVVAFVKDIASGQVLNSGTKFDVVASGTQEAPTHNIQFSPNPAGAFTYASIDDDKALSTTVYSVDGKLVYQSSTQPAGSISIPTATLAPGIYFVKIKGQKAAYSSKFVKE